MFVKVNNDRKQGYIQLCSKINEQAQGLKTIVSIEYHILKHNLSDI